MKKKTLLILWGLLPVLMALLPQTVVAQEAEPAYLVLEFADQSTRGFQLAAKPEIVFLGDKLNVTSDALDAEFNRADVAQFYFAETWTDPGGSVNSPANDDSILLRYVDNETVTVSGASLTGAKLYNLDGKLLISKGADNGTITISLNGQNSGVYILTLSNNQSYKIIKK